MARELDLIDIPDHPFQWTRGWFRNRNLPTFRQHIYPVWRDKPGLVYLELGVFEGMSACWMLQRVLTHETSRVVCVDPWLMTTKLDTSVMEGVYHRALENLASWCHPLEANHDLWKCRVIRANSAEVLRRMCSHGFAGITKDSVDLCMIDGNHNDLAVLDDLRHCVQLVKSGGWLLLDDVENDIEKKDHVRQGVDMWLKESPPVELAWKDRYMECYTRL